MYGRKKVFLVGMTIFLVGSAFSGMATSMIQAVGTLGGRWLRGARGLAHPGGAPRTRLNGSITANRSVAFGTVPLDDLKAVRAAFATTINDVVLAMCTAGLRRYLTDHDTLPDRALVCSVPVSVHGDSTQGSANQVSNMFVHLPVHLADPVEQLRAIHEGTEGAKEVQSAIGANMIGDVVELLPPPLFAWAAQQWSKAGMAPGTFGPTKVSVGGGRCRGGNINGLDATLCEFDDVAAAKRAEAAGLAEIRGVTGLALAEGKLLLVLADPKQTDPSGRSMNELAKAFRNR